MALGMLCRRASVAAAFLLVLALDLHIATFIGFARGEDTLAVALKEEECRTLSKSARVVLVFAYSGECEDCTTQRRVVNDVEVHQTHGVLSDLVVAECKVANVEEWSLGEFEQGPVLVYVRNGVPIVYDGEWDTISVTMWLTANNQRLSTIFTDETFEHLTQASTGATTGHWMVLFFSDDCPVCERLRPVWETACSRLHPDALCGEVNISESTALKERFSISSTPTIIYFRAGKQYDFPHPEDIGLASDMVSFARTGFEKVPGQEVKKPLPGPVEWYQHVAMLIAVLIPFGLVGILLLRQPNPKNHEEDVAEVNDMDLDIPRSPTLPNLTKQRTSTTPARRRPSLSRRQDKSSI